MLLLFSMCALWFLLTDFQKKPQALPPITKLLSICYWPFFKVCIGSQLLIEIFVEVLSDCLAAEK